jgi:hypothetical protein
MMVVLMVARTMPVTMVMMVVVVVVLVLAAVMKIAEKEIMKAGKRAHPESLKTAQKAEGARGTQRTVTMRLEAAVRTKRAARAKKAEI